MFFVVNTTENKAYLILSYLKLPAQRTSNVENISIWWRHYVDEFIGRADARLASAGAQEQR